MGRAIFSAVIAASMGACACGAVADGGAVDMGSSFFAEAGPDKIDDLSLFGKIGGPSRAKTTTSHASPNLLLSHKAEEVHHRAIQSHDDRSNTQAVSDSCAPRLEQSQM